jgi:oligopeptide transport system substrate-binding protein
MRASMMRKCLSVLSLIVAASVYAADAPSHMISLRLIGEPETLDWNKAHTTVETFILTNLMDGLVTFDSNMEVAPDLAKSWTVSPDRRTYTFHLRTDVKWSDGVPLKAKDFVYSWKRLLTPGTAASYAYFLYDVEGAEAFNKGKLKDFNSVGIKALDDSSFQVRLTRPMSHWLYVPSFWVTYPLRQDVVEKYGALTSSSWAAPGKMVTLGAFTLALHEHDSKIVLKSNPYFYAPHGNVETADFLIVKEDSTALNLYETGKLDFLTDIASVDLKRLAGRADLRAFPYYKTGYIGYVVNRPPLNNVHVRRAISMAIDKAQIGKILHGSQQPATSWVPPRMMAHSDNLGFSYDPTKAKEELALAGPIDSSQPIQIVIPNWDKTEILSQFIQEQVKKTLGLNLSIQQFDHKTFRAQVDLRVFPLFMLSWSADFPDPDDFMSVFITGAGNNRLNWSNKRYDQLVLTARGLQDLKSRERMYSEAQRILLEEDAAIIPLYYEPNMALVRPRLQGLELNPLNYLLLKKVNISGS